MQVSVAVDGENEQILQELLRQKLTCSSGIAPLPAGELMEEFHAELNILSNEFIHQREGAPSNDNFFEHEFFSYSLNHFINYIKNQSITQFISYF